MLYFLKAMLKALGSKISNMTFPCDMVDMDMVDMDMVGMNMVDMVMMNMDMVDMDKVDVEMQNTIPCLFD